ncbi:hypothetical protein DM01DRAFT_1316000 [Hesseltinella vesiculosa]|uniref:F-box domain-containing protein n=1 Tax=Hesseltinella vesiculosa TaxID=101127 RepID=A0A1X2GTI7_9FUNG|nr:hypothetical protein DM01DRAFT_1316000 [Hesseltinella vesiculosa]
MSIPTPNSEQELNEFRERWKQEVVSKQHSGQQTNAADTEDHHSIVDDNTSSSCDKALVNDISQLTIDEPERQSQYQPTTAFELYDKAVDLESQGQLGKALDHYRQAFRIDSDVDKNYHKYCKGGSTEKLTAKIDLATKTDEFRHIIPIGSEYIQGKDSSSHEPFKALLEDFSMQDLSLVPRLDYRPVFLAKLPNEILVTVMKYATLLSLATFFELAVVCKKFCLLTRSPTIWRCLCEQAYRPPGISHSASQRLQESYVKENYRGHWMKMFIERPRLRFDGVYISTCHYIRPGSSENSWNQPVHLVTYYRYLRFFPDGTVVKHVTTAEPIVVVRRLSKYLRKRQTFVGTFRWRRNDDGDLFLQINSQDLALPNERFFMTLVVKGTQRGRHNKLVWKKYTSVNENQIAERQEALYDLKLMKPYFFSPVRSYHKKYLIHFVFEPSANMVNAHGQLLYNTTIGFSSLKKFPYSAGDTMMPLQVEFNYDNGDPIDYPFDRYTGYFEIDAFANVWTNVIIPLSFRLEASMTSFSFTPTFTAFEQHLGLQILTGRSNTTLGFSLFMCLLMWALSLVLAVFGYQVMFRHRPVHAHGCMIGVTMLFALPTLRSAQPGVPENTGCIADVLGYYWNMAIIALETIAILGCWVARWSPNNEKAKGTHEPSKTDSQTTLHKFGHLEHIEHFA